MADFLHEVFNSIKFNNCNELLENAKDIIGTTIVEQVNMYTEELDTLISQMHNKTNKDNYEISDKELEKLIIRLPVLIYNLNNVLMNAGIKEDLSKIIRLNQYNASFVIQEGTIADKKSAAELSIKEEILLETTWKRSVKIISQKMEIAQELLSACKKILSKRMQALDIIRYNGGNV